MRSYAMKFDGELLKRGFWLYVWRVTHGKDVVLYVGRTGDSSSSNASSPFKRAGQHLGTNANNNALARCLNERGFQPERCTFEMIAVGPLYNEQKGSKQHSLLRDKTAALESVLAAHLKDNGYDVRGKHPRQRAYDKRVYARLCRVVDEQLRALELAS